MKPNPLLRAVSFLVYLLGSSWASAATFSVNSYVDSVDVAPGDGTCADSAGLCTMRAAILEANALPGPDTILAPPGVHNMTIAGADEDLGLTGDLDVLSDVTIIGLGTTRIESQVGRVIHVLSGNVSVTGLTLTLGDAGAETGSGRAGGAVHNGSASTLTLNNCTVIQNAGQGGGGGIFNGGTLSLNASTMNVNSAVGTSAGGAVLNSGMMTITNSTLSGNSATAGGGGVFSTAGSTLIMNNVTVASNASSGGTGGGGITIDAAADAILSNTILGDNQASGPEDDCQGTITSLGGNLVEVTAGCTGLDPNDITGVGPMLGPLQDNGGRTFTQALLPGSPAIDAGGFSPCELTDQRGLSRPQGTGCDIGAFEFFPNCPAITVNPATLPDGDPGVFYTQTVTASGGVAPHTFSITSGSLPTGLALNSTTGVIEGVPTTVGVFTFTVTAFDDNFCPGSRTYTVVIGVPCSGVTIALSPTSLPPGAQGQSYSQQVTATGGTGPYQYVITSGFLPPGLALDASTGVISGVPTATGAYLFVVTATDANLCTGSQAYVLTIACLLDVQPATLPDGTEGIAYSQTLSAASGATPVTFAVISGSLPPGLSLTGAGVLSGTPTTPGTYTFVIEATDANNCTGSRGYTVVIDPCLVVSPDTLPDGVVGTPYSQQLTAVGGTPPITFATAGPLPPGLTLSPTGLISGDPTTGGISLFTVDASDTGGCTTSKDYFIVVNPPGCPTITISPTVLPDGQVGQNYNQNLNASGGTGPYTFTFLTGAIPAGLTVDAGGNVSGTPIESGIFTFTVAATDSNGCTGTQTITLSVFPVNCPLIALFPSDLPDGITGVVYGQTLTATGGAAPYAYTLTAGSLPLGLSLSTAGVISGTPTAVGSFSFTITATDTALCFGSGSYTLNVLPQALTELVHGTILVANLASVGAVSDEDFFRIRQRPHASYEVVVDGISGDIGSGAGPALERLDSDATTVLQPSVAAGAGGSRSLRWMNTTGAIEDGQFVRVRSLGCTTSCDADDVYRIRAWDTTVASPRFNNSASQVTLVVVQNTSPQLVAGRIAFWSATGNLLHEEPFTLAPKALVSLNAASLPALQGQSGTLTVSHDGPYGSVAGKVVAVEPATGFTFDSPIAPRLR